jgi:hypothetical protein
VTASWDERPNPPPAGVAQTAAHGGVPAVPHVVETPTATTAGASYHPTGSRVIGSGRIGSGVIGSGLIGRFDLRDLIIVTIGFSIGFALVRELKTPGFVLALITLPAVGRVIYVKRRLERAGESLTWMGAAKAYAGAIVVMTVSVIPAIWVGILIGFVAALVLGILAYLFVIAVHVPVDLARNAVYIMALVIGTCAGVAALVALPRFFWRRWDLQLLERVNRAADTSPPTESITAESITDQPISAVEAAPRPQSQARKQRRYDGNPRRF